MSKLRDKIEDVVTVVGLLSAAIVPIVAILAVWCNPLFYLKVMITSIIILAVCFIVKSFIED